MFLTRLNYTLEEFIKNYKAYIERADPIRKMDNSSRFEVDPLIAQAIRDYTVQEEYQGKRGFRRMGR